MKIGDFQGGLMKASSDLGNWRMSHPPTHTNRFTSFRSNLLRVRDLCLYMGTIFYRGERWM